MILKCHFGRVRFPLILIGLLVFLLAFVLSACGAETTTPTPPDTLTPATGTVPPSPMVTQPISTSHPVAETVMPSPLATPFTQTATPSLRAMVSIEPQAYVVERVGGNFVAVSVMVPPGSFPGTYEPKPAQMVELSNTDVYFQIDFPFEHSWIDRFRAANPTMQIIDTTQGITRIPGISHSHEEEHEDEHAEEGEHPDPHIWLSPTLMKVQARTVADALIALDPTNEANYEANLSGLIADIDALHQDITKNLASLTIRKFLVFHPAWGYFARDYGLEMIPVEVGGQEPSAAELAALIQKAKAEGITVVFAQPQMNPQSARTIATEIGGEVILIDPLAHDWLDNLKRVSETFAKVLSHEQETE